MNISSACFCQVCFLLQGEVLDFFPRGFGCLTKELMVRGEDVEELGGVSTVLNTLRTPSISLFSDYFVF